MNASFPSCDRRRIFRLVTIALFLSSGILAACSGWEPSKPFERNAPQVSEAIEILDGGDAGGASAILEGYLSTGTCSEGSIGAPLLVRTRPNGGVDLGIALFRVAEGYGQRFGDEEKKNGGLDQMKKAVRGGDIECARKIVKAIADDESVAIDLRARARYIDGNLLFLDGNYKDAVKSYDEALILAPGMMGDGGEEVGRDAAWNRAIALRRIDDQKDAGQDASTPDGGENNPDSSDNQNDASSPPDAGKGDGGGQGNSNKDGGQGKDSGGNDQQPDGGNNDNDQRPDAGQQAPQSPQPLDDSILDRLENAPTVQQEAAKKQQGKVRPVRRSQDK